MMMMLSMRNASLLAVCAMVASQAAGADDGPSPYDLTEIRDPKTLDIEVVHDWRLVPGTPPTRQKEVLATACTWWPGREVRLPIVFVAPAEGGPFPFIISSIGLTSGRAVRPDELEQALLPRGVAFVRVGIGQIDQMEPAGVLADEMNALFLKTKNVRYTPPWFWGLTYMRAVTAALTEPTIYKAGKVGATGGSKRGLASAAAAAWDDRVTVIVPIVAPIFSEPQYNPRHPELDEAFLRLAEQGKTGLAVDEVSRLRAIRANNSRYWLDDDDYLAAGWTREDTASAERRLGELHLARYNVARWDARGVDYFIQIGTNDKITPRLPEFFAKHPRFSCYVVPGGQHGTDGVGNQKRTPMLADVKANTLAVFSNHFFGDRPRMQTPRFTVRREGGVIRVQAAFDEGPPARTSTLYWSFDRLPEGSLPYEHSSWQSAPMRQVDEQTWDGEIAPPPESTSVDVLCVCSDDVRGMPMHISGPLVRVGLD